MLQARSLEGAAPGQTALRGLRALPAAEAHSASPPGRPPLLFALNSTPHLFPMTRLSPLQLPSQDPSLRAFPFHPLSIVLDGASFSNCIQQVICTCFLKTKQTNKQKQVPNRKESNGKALQ